MQWSLETVDLVDRGTAGPQVLDLLLGGHAAIGKVKGTISLRKAQQRGMKMEPPCEPVGQVI